MDKRAALEAASVASAMATYIAFAEPGAFWLYVAIWVSVAIYWYKKERDG